MEYKIRMGVPEMEQFWEDLKNKVNNNIASKQETKLYKQVGKALYFLSKNPKYPSLNTHEIHSLSARFNKKVWESYLENNTPAAGRIFWSYGPNKKDITILAIEPHPNDSKSDAYRKIVLSKFGKEIC